MRRSEIDTIIDETRAVMRRHGVALPPFADWSPQDWQRHGAATETMRHRLIGWNIAEFERGAFARSGIALITTRMGDFEELPTGRGKLYGEKIFVIRDGQSVPYHYHRVKTEDVFNRGGATLAIDLVAVGADGRPTNAPIDLDRDGLPFRVASRGTVRLAPGEGINLVPGIAHAFRAEGGAVVCGEISLANDDTVDNYFLDPLPAPAPIDEDAPARHVVVADYAKFGAAS